MLNAGDCDLTPDGDGTFGLVAQRARLCWLTIMRSFAKE
jgi:hypothetical protein